MIMNGNSTPEELKSINELGYLTSCYDAYQDVFQVEANGKLIVDMNICQIISY